MNLVFEAEWPLSDTDKGWLDGYVRNQFAIGGVAVREICAVASIDPADVEVTVHLYDRITPEGRYGLTWPPGSRVELGPNQYRIDVAWYQEFTVGDDVVRHEGRHLFAHIATGDANFGHAEPSPPDPFIGYLKRWIAAVYQANPDAPPDVRLRHVRDLTVDL